jgi:hypothetical protein
MKRIIIFLLVFSITGCEIQEKDKQTAKDIQKTDTIIKPKEKWDVKKEYDEFGNLIKYDSVYSWSYSNIKGDSLKVNLDSVMDSFQLHFQNWSNYKMNDYFSYFPKRDSLFMNDFFMEDYFFKNWQSHHFEFEKIMKKMDSSRNAFLKKVYPGLIESKERL